MRTKKLALSAALALSFSTSAFANCIDCPECGSYGLIDNCNYVYPVGFYVGLSLGYGVTWWRDLDELSVWGSPFDIDANTGAPGGRLSIGYDFGPNFAVELGGAYFYKQDFRIFDRLNNDSLLLDVSMHAYAVDLIGKVKLPLDNGFYLFTTLGAFYFSSSKVPELINGVVVETSNRSNYNVTFGAGAGYYFTPCINMELTWARYSGSLTVDQDYMPNSDYFSLGMSYKFVAA